MNLCDIDVIRAVLAKHGFHFSKDELRDRMEARIGLPVINVREDAR